MNLHIYPALLAALTLGLGLSAGADDDDERGKPPAVTAVGKNGATVTLWAEGLSGPQGLAARSTGNVFVVENGTGRVLRFSRDGQRRDVAAEGLRAPAFAALLGSTLYVSERDGNSVARIPRRGAVTRLPGEVVDPLGLAATPERLLVVSHRQSLVRQYRRGGAKVTDLLPEPYLSPASGAKYGWRDIAIRNDGAIYITDELSGAVLRRVPGGELTAWVTGLSSPSGLALASDGAVYVTEEGDGRLSRLTKEGAATVLAENLGKAREVIRLDARTLLVSDRAGGNIWKVSLPR